MDRTVFGLRIVTVAAGAALAAACATPPPPPAPPPPPPPPALVEQTPYRPLPPGGAAYVMEIPPRGTDGERLTVNRDLTEDELVWHFRSGWNVAALNCTADRYQPILDGYGAFIKNNERELKRINDRLEKLYRSRSDTRRGAMVARDGRTTMVYNFFALPPARSEFCTAALEMANRALANPPKDALQFARDNFQLLVDPFHAFFDAYERYQQASAAWDAKYGDLYGPSQPGWVAVQQARANGIAVPRAGESDPASTITNPRGAMMVTDPETGEKVPVVPIDERVLSQPVTQPLPADANERDLRGGGD